MWLKFLEKYGIIRLKLKMKVTVVMGKIVCLMGKSSSGKDTIYKRLLSQKSVPLETIVPYTTRPIRAGEQDGVEYHFTDEAGFQSLLAQGSVVESREYNTLVDCGVKHNIIRCQPAQLSFCLRRGARGSRSRERWW